MKPVSVPPVAAAGYLTTAPSRKASYRQVGCYVGTRIRRLNQRICAGLDRHQQQDEHQRIRMLSEQWKRIRKAAAGTLFTPNQLLVQLPIEALKRHEWQRTEANFIC